MRVFTPFREKGPIYENEEWRHYSGQHGRLSRKGVKVLIEAANGKVKFGLPLPPRYRGARVYILSDSSPRVLASQPWFLFRIEPDFHLLSQASEWS